MEFLLIAEIWPLAVQESLSTASAQRERENYSLASNLENVINIDSSGFDYLPDWSLGPVAVSRERGLVRSLTLDGGDGEGR